MFIAALFTVARTWKQPKCSLTEGWIRKIWYIYNEILLSHKERNSATCRDVVDLETAIQSEVSQKEKNKYPIILLICGISKNGTDELICKAEIETQV